MTLPGDVIMMRRHAATPHDVTCSPYFIAASNNRIGPVDNAKPKKSWGERLKIGSSKTPTHDERRPLGVDNNNYLHPHADGSALSKSMKYAETWLYSGGQFQAPSNLPTLIPHITMCSCPEFIGGTVRSTKHTTSAGTCKKCGGSRMPWRGGGTMRAQSVRITDVNRIGGTVRVGQTRHRPSLSNLTPSLKPYTPDPYDLMRRNRLGGSSGAEEVDAMKSTVGRARAKSEDRMKIRRSPSPPVVRLSEPRRSRRDLSWGDDDLSDMKRKSILECAVNPYQLMTKYKEENVDKEEVLRDEDEMSDDLSDNALENVGVATLEAEKPTPLGVTISGQRMNVSTGPQDGEYIQDDVSPRTTSLIPRLQSPKRPQRRRGKSLEGGKKSVTVAEVRDEENESSTTSSRSNSLIERRSNNLPSSSIKSILKKPSAPAGMSDTALAASSTSSTTPRQQEQKHQQPRREVNTFSDTIREPDALHSTSQRGKSSNFSSSSCRESRKKKQVQFHDAVVGDVATGDIVDVTEDCSGVSACEEHVIAVTFKVSEARKALKYFGDTTEDVLAVSSEKDKEAPGMAPTVMRDDWSDHHLGQDISTPAAHPVTLRRSLSDRQIAFDVEDDVRTAATFNDTMRLRQLAGRRSDSRQAFSRPSERVRSPARPKEPPPPPPPLPSPDPLPSPPPFLAQATAQDDDMKLTIKKKSQQLKLMFKKEEKSLGSSEHVQETHIEVRDHDDNLKTTSLKKEATLVPLNHESHIEVKMTGEVSSTITPPPPPPRHIFPFTKRQIQSINKRPRGLTRPNSCIPHLKPSPDASSRIRHRNSDPGPAMSTISLRTVDSPDVSEGVRTIVSVCPDSPDVHRLQIKNEDFPSRRTSILINGDDVGTVIVGENSKNNINKVTISVGGPTNQTTWANLNNNHSYTIIDTETNSLPHVNPCTNQITIPVTPEPVYNQRSNIQVEDHSALIVDSTTGKSLGENHDYEVLEVLMDPVEAVKRHLVPHVCGKVNPDGGVNLVSHSAMERLNSLLIEQKHFSESSSVIEVSSPESSLTDTPKYSSTEKSDSGEENNGISVHYFTADCIPHFVLGEEQTDDSSKQFYDDAENIYESIKDPIYEEIGLPDTPPPLPLSPPPSLDELDDKRTSRSIFEGASKYDILNYLVDAKERGYVESDYNNVDDTKGIPVVLTSLGNLSSRVSNLSNASDSSEESTLITTSIDTKDEVCRKSSADVERNDSGVGSETSKSSRSRWQNIPNGTVREDQAHLCEDCDQHVETQVTDGGVMFAPLVCRKCAKKRAERKETIAEIVETEEKYGRDLRIILEEFYRPMLVAGLLTVDQLGAIFLNVEELVENNAALAEKLRDAHEIAVEQGDEDLLTVNIGSLFLEAAPMLHAFESYCTRQGAASLLLANLEKEKELLRIFLRVSQMENAVLRRMNLNSFLMVPVQRVTKYPLLLARLYKVTPAHHEGRELLKQAQHKIELHLEHMNSVAKDISSTRLWRRISIVNGRRSSSEIDMINIKLRKLAVDVLDWNLDEVKFAMEGRLLYTNPTDNNWRKGRTIKLNPISALLVTYGKQTEVYRPEDEHLLFPKRTGVKEATLLLVKEKCGRYSLLRDPLYLDKCIVCCETDWEDYFEVQELASKDTFIFKAEDSERTKLWYRQLQYHSQGHGAWRRRRNALANIMINGMLARS